VFCLSFCFLVFLSLSFFLAFVFVFVFVLSFFQPSLTVQVLLPTSIAVTWAHADILYASWVILLGVAPDVKAGWSGCVAIASTDLYGWVGGSRLCSIVGVGRCTLAHTNHRAEPTAPTHPDISVLAPLYVCCVLCVCVGGGGHGQGTSECA